MRKLYWYLGAYLRKHGVMIIATLIIGVVIFSLFIPWIASRLETKSKRYIGVVGSYTLVTLPKDIQQLMSSGLTKIEKDGTVSPDLAARWSVEDGGRTYRFVIRDGVTWQDGKALQPQDITYQFDQVEVVTTPNDVIFKLPDTFVPFPTSVAQPLFRIVTTKNWLGSTQQVLLGTGEYRMISSKQPGQRLIELVLDGPKEQLVYRFYLTEADAITAYKLGRVDELADIASPNELRDWEQTIVSERRDAQRYLAVFFDLSKPKFQKNVRQALSYALTKPTDETRAIGPINSLSWAYLESGKTYEYDLDRAVERLLSDVPPEPLIFDLSTLPSFISRAEALKTEWTALGEKAYAACQSEKTITDKKRCDNVKPQVNIRVTNFPDTSNFDALLVAQESPADPDQYALWHSSQSTNFTHYKNTRIDSLLEKGRQVAERQERQVIYQEFQQFFLEDAPAIFLEYLPTYSVERD